MTDTKRHLTTPTQTATAVKSPSPAKALAVLNVTAVLRHLRMSPMRMRLLANSVKRMPALTAIDYLRLVPRRAAEPLRKLIASAVANGTHNLSLDKDKLVITSITVNEGSVLKRWTPKAYGRATPIRKRSCHIVVVLTQIGATKKNKAEPVTPAAAVTTAVSSYSDVLKNEVSTGLKPTAASTAPKQRLRRQFGQKFFNRKTG